MLNAYPDGEGLGGHGHSGVQQHLESVAGGVSGGEHQRVAGQVVPAAGTVHRNGPQGAVPHVQARQPVPEAHVAPQGQQLPPHIAHHVPENVGADVGLVLVEDVRRGARLHQRPEDRGDAGIVGAGGQLAVGEGATSAVRSSTGRPRSSTMGMTPFRAKKRAANSPEGPMPTTTGGRGEVRRTGGKA